MTDSSLLMPEEPWLIDVHQHFVPDFYRAEVVSSGRNIPPWVNWDKQSALDFMDQNLVQKGLLSITTPGVNFGDTAAGRKLARKVNDTAADLAQAHKGRFGAFASLPLPDVEGSLQEIEYSLDTLVLEGVVLLSSQHDGSYLGDSKYDSIMEELNRRKAVVFVHPGTPIFYKDVQLEVSIGAGEYVFDTTRAIMNLVWSGTAHRCPDIKFIFSHAGGTLPSISWRVDSLFDNLDIEHKEKHFPLGAMAYFKRFNYDLAQSTSPASIAALQELIPKSQMFYGSDFPFAPKPLLEASNKMFYQSTFLQEQERMLIGRKNALSMFGDD